MNQDKCITATPGCKEIVAGDGNNFSHLTTAIEMKLLIFNEVDGGGLFAVWDEPELVAADPGAVFKSLHK